MGEDISDIRLEQLIIEAKQGNNDSLGILMSSPQIAKLLNQVSTQVAREFNVSAILIREELFDRLCIKIRTIRKPNFKSLKTWSFSTMRNYCRNEYRHNQVVARHSEQVIHEGTSGKRKSAGGPAKPLPIPANNSPEDILLQKEKAAFLDDLCSRVLKIFDTFPQRDQVIVILWAQGKTLKETRELTGIPLSTVGKRLKKRQQLIIEEIGLQFLIDAKPELLKVAYEFISNTIQDMGDFENYPPRAA